MILNKKLFNFFSYVFDTSNAFIKVIPALRHTPLPGAAFFINKRLYYSGPSGETINNNDNNQSNDINPRITEIIESISNTQTFNTALTHKSSLKSNSTIKSYETLKFLGDSILQFYISIFLFKYFPHYSEGRLAEERIMLTQNKYLGHPKLTLKIGLYKYL